MAVKPAAGEVVEQTTRTRVVPAAELEPTPAKRPPFWDWIDTQSLADWNNNDLVINLYRGRKNDRGEWCEKFVAPPFSHDEVQKKYGGGEYNVMVKYNKQLIYNEDFSIAGAPRNDIEVLPPAGPQSEIKQMLDFMKEQNALLVAELRAARGGDAGTRAIEQAVGLSGQVFASSLTAAQTAIGRIAEPHGAPTASPMDEMMRQFMAAAIAKMMNPADPIENFSKMVTAMKAMGLTDGGGGGPKNISAQLISVLPTVLDKVQAGMASMVQMREQEIRVQMLARGQAPPAMPQNIPPQPQPAANVTEMPAPQPAQTDQQAQNPQVGFWEFLDSGVLNILSDPNKPIDEAATEALIFFDAAGAGSLVDDLIKQGDNGEAILLQLFQTRPILQRVPQNPRLTEFIKKFLELAKESRSPEPPAPAV